MLLDDNRQPGMVMRWLLKKDNVSRKYYQTLLQLEVQLREHLPAETISTDDVLHCIFEQKFAKGAYVSKSYADYDISPAKPATTFSADQAKRDRKRKSYAVIIPAALILFITAVLFFRPTPEQHIVHVPYLPQADTNPAIVQQQTIDNKPWQTFPQSLDLLVLSEQVIPAGVREVFRPAMGPIKETYDIGKEQLLEDLASLPIQPLTELGRRFYPVASNGLQNSGGLPENDSHENHPKTISDWLNPQIFNVNWLIPAQP